ncbi:MAG TPA: flavodoxin family protein [bacterium]|nr:flavodoxin family protein [bacterium]
MKIITIMGSPRKRGNTDAALTIFEDMARDAGHTVTRINLAGVNVGQCVSCWKCMESTDEPGCPQKDDAGGVFSSMIESDGIIYATPLYCWSFSAQMKALIDRHVCLVKGFETGGHKSFLEGKKTALLVTCEGAETGNADIIRTLFERLTNEYLLMNNAGEFIISGCGIEPRTLPPDAGSIINRMAESFI